MTPTNQDIVDAAKRAGIPVRIMTHATSCSFEGWLCIAVGPDHYYVDQPEGSALFIVAVLGVLPGVIACRSKFMGGGWTGWNVEWEGGNIEHASTLAEACMAAIVAAYPEEVGE